jgi:hypothetical protein
MLTSGSNIACKEAAHVIPGAIIPVRASTTFITTKLFTTKLPSPLVTNPSGSIIACITNPSSPRANSATTHSSAIKLPHVHRPIMDGF